ncbi:hypothetical protein [Flammeovirga agarivorans]|uniref:Phosphatidate cytidylyltransferase n=1 Tax=Flammeovirga agarivorans TaxID=2726742 RepID=A0A7X8SR35_9BACT|nr:hypothetical protein [Flammeovirga agarivorans]NLR94857.1 hypothetical protein [Flammeovirga agarivorans]
MIKRDKQLHLLAGFTIALITYVASKTFIFEGISSYCLAIAVSAIAGLFRELYNEADYGVFDWYDLLATAIGGASILIPLSLYYLLLIAL